MVKRSSLRARYAVAGTTGIVLAATLLTACGSSKSSTPDTTTPSTASTGSSAPSSTPTSAAASDALGADNKASGDPVLLGFAYDGKSAAIDTSLEAVAANAVVKYANDHLGGVGGRPIELFTCETKADPAAAQDCGNQFVAKKVIAVAGGSLGTTAPVVSALTTAKIPYVDILNQDATVLGTPGKAGTNFSIENPLNAIGGGAAIAKQNGVKSAALIVIDVAAAIDPAKQLGPLLYGNAGATLNVVGVAPGTADMTPQIQAAEAKKPGQYALIGNPQFCAAALKAIKTLGITSPVVGIDRCLDKTAAAAVQGGFAGLKVFGTANLDPATKEFQLFDAIRTTYSSGTDSDGNYVAGYQGFMSLVRALNAGGITDFTGTGAATAIAAAKDVPTPLGGDTATFSCDGKQIAVSTAICSVAGFLADATADGGEENFSTINDPSIYVFPTK